MVVFTIARFSFIVLLACAASIASAAPPPNVLFVLADQWRAQAFGYAGDGNAKTPHLDELEGQSVRFTNAVSSVPVCSPARASLLTGQRALTHGVFMNDVPLSPDAVTLAKVMAAGGYDTGYIGKWHLNGDGRSAFIPRERREGFDYWKVLECTHAYNHSFYYADGPEKLLWDGYDAIAQTRDAQQYLRDHAKGAKPFVLFLAWGPPHDPYGTAPEKYRAIFDPQHLVVRPNVPPSIHDQALKNMAGYYAHCAALDNCMGDLWQSCRELGIEDNTLIIFIADHGDLLGSHGFYNKQQPYEESACVPLLLHWPAGLGRKSLRIPAAIGTEDVMPTLLGLCGLPIPSTVQGQDFSHCATGGPDPSDGASLISCPAPFGQWNRLLGGKEYRAIRTARYTYARDLKGPWLLFDHQTDPYEMTNLVGTPEAANVQAELDATLQHKLKANGDEFLPAADYIRKWGYRVDKNGTVPYEN